MQATKLSFRVFVIEDKNSILPISQKSFNDFYLRNEPSLVKFAGRLLHIAVVYCAMTGRIPKHIVRVDSMRVKVNDDGRVDQDHVHQAMVLGLDGAGQSLNRESIITHNGPVVDASSEFDKRRLKQLHPQISGPAHKLILCAIFGNVI